MICLLQGILVGIVFGIPAGAIGALSIQRAFEHGFKAGFVTGLGSTVADMIYALAGVLGITMIQTFVQRWNLPICIVGGTGIVAMGITTLRKHETSKSEKESNIEYPFMILSAFTIAICNPATVFSFLAVFAMLGLGKMSKVEGILLVVGIGIGTCIWWFAISSLVCRIKEKTTEKIQLRLYKIMGILLVIFGALVIINGCK